MLTPTYRLLHNTVHALVPDQAFITPTISLRQLAEFAYLVRRYRSVIDWREWLGKGACHGLGRQFRVYLTLAHRLMGMPFPAHVPRVVFPSLQVARIAGAENNRADYSLRIAKHLRPTAAKRIKAVALRIFIIDFSA